jgi:hypothetical protein
MNFQKPLEQYKALFGWKLSFYILKYKFPTFCNGQFQNERWTSLLYTFDWVKIEIPISLHQFK